VGNTYLHIYVHIYSKFHAFQQCKIFDNVLRFDKVTESLQVRPFLRHSGWLYLLV